MVRTLSPEIHPGLVNRAGTTPESQKLVETLLEDDRKRHHCFVNAIGFHNHLSHHLLAAYDLGASAKLLQAINDDAADGVKRLLPIDKGLSQPPETLSEKNWTQHLGQHSTYLSYLNLFTDEISANGAGATIEKYIFRPEANGNGSSMFSRFLGGAIHPLIQTGYAAEFGSDAMVAQGLALTAVTAPFAPALFDPFDPDTPSAPLPLFEILRRAYDSPALAPVMPYDPESLFAAATPDRISAIRALAAQWFSLSDGASELRLARAHEELLWAATLLLAGSGKAGRKPRPDFFLLHVLNASLFLPSLLKLLENPASKAALMRGFLSTLLLITIAVGRPRIDPALMMSYTATPHPPTVEGTTLADNATPAPCTVGDPHDPACTNPWDVLIPAVLHAPDGHVAKCLRTLYYAAQHFGSTAPGAAPGADAEGRETHKGIAEMDGSVFVRAAGVVMDRLGWVTYGQELGSWDRSGMGWEEAWEGED